MRGPSYRDVDLAVMRRIGLGGEHAIELRAEIFNLLNTTNFGAPVAMAGAASFGTITTALDPRGAARGEVLVLRALCGSNHSSTLAMTPSASASIVSMPIGANYGGTVGMVGTRGSPVRGDGRALTPFIQANDLTSSINRHLGMMQDVATGIGFHA